MRQQNAKAHRDWIEIKRRLRSSMRYDDFEAIVRPMFLLALSGDCLVVAVPRNLRIIERAKRCALLQAAVRELGYSGAFATFYPSDDELLRIRERFPDIFERFSRPLRERASRLAIRRATEDARDRQVSACQ